MKARILALGALLALGGCVVQPPQPSQPETPPPAVPPTKPSVGTPPGKTPPRTVITPQPSPRPAQSNRPTQFAPPPGGNGRWDASLGVYVIQGQKDLYYRQRTYYRWDDGWYWGVSPQGPWTATDSSGIPPGLTRRHAAD
ncbi:hypothetical protein [Pseudomonas schmalbachii]|uniref:Lipoprotein n=1 Tax=Pseudomonas schmalbachii TaxID=2816993 RepID=A0ABS3TRI3_9PSED|nr:hypothetical protein [Pseudomonas schmalbachii]MBO3275728.1 hypothetical protein [Pseudomonas schmalbachii]